MAKSKQHKRKQFISKKNWHDKSKSNDATKNKNTKNHLQTSADSCPIPTSSVYKRATVYPASYLRQFPKNRFVEPSDEQFNDIISVCYSGLALTPPKAFPTSFHDIFSRACRGLDEKGMYQFDLTQPTGLGTKVVKTFVSRCLVGCPGITYKYLGLRMFAFPWTPGEVGANDETVAIGELNNAMIHHTEKLLTARGGEVGSCQYNLTLINRCYPEKSQEDAGGVTLKEEPMFKQNKCAVSWHADSTLEHFSTIGVYHFTSPNAFASSSTACEVEEEKEESMWRIALRVYHDAEGPSAGKNADPSHPETSASPSILLPLPSRHSYFLLDDFNHHHQHAVVAGSTHRISSTHRVCRTDGHTFDSIRRRSLSALQSPNKLAPKVIRSQQLALNDVEFEWIRQFYIQGQKHQSLHVWWAQPMEILVDLWNQLERSTEFVLHVLQEAAIPTLNEENCNLSKRYRKKMAKIKKFSSAVEVGSYDALLEYLNTREEKRRGWKQREKDPIFRSISREYHPLPPPLHHGTHDTCSVECLFSPSQTTSCDNDTEEVQSEQNTKQDVAQSPLPERLDAVIKHVEHLKMIFLSKK